MDTAIRGPVFWEYESHKWAWKCPAVIGYFAKAKDDLGGGRGKPHQEAGFRTMRLLRDCYEDVAVPLRDTAGPLQGLKLSRESRSGLGSTIRIQKAGWGKKGSGASRSENRARFSSRGRGCGGVVLPSASQSIHFPNLLFRDAEAPADSPGDVRRDPGKCALGSGIKLHHECGYCLWHS